MADLSGNKQLLGVFIPNATGVMSHLPGSSWMPLANERLPRHGIITTD